MEKNEEYTAWVTLFAGNVQQNGIALPSIDLFFAPRGDLRAKAAAAVSVLAHIEDREQGRSAFATIQVIAPKGGLQLEGLAVAATRMLGDGAGSAVRLEELEQLTIEAVQHVVSRCPEASAVLIMDAALFASSEGQPPTLGGDPRFALSEDIWAPQLLQLIQALERTNESKKCYLVVDVGELYPARKALQDSFMGIETLAIITYDTPAKANEVLAKHVDLWKELLDAGRLGQALASIEALPAAFAQDKKYLRIRVLHEAGLVGQALDEIGALDTSTATVDAALSLAKIAAEAGGLVISRNLLSATQPNMVSLQQFELAINVAQLLESDALLSKIEAGYRKRYPNQTAQHERILRRLIEAGLYEDAFQRSVGLPPDTISALEFCRAFLPADTTPNYPEAARALDKKEGWSTIAFVWMTNDALRRHLVVHAFELVFGYMRPRLQTLGEHAFKVMRELLLSVANGSWPVDEERINAAFHDLVGYAALHPNKPGRRFKLENLLSHKVVGARGLTKLLHLIMNARPPAIFELNPKSASSADPTKVEAAIRTIMELLQQEGMAVAGRLQAPPGIFSGAGIADATLTVAEHAVEDQTKGALTDNRISEALIWLSISSMAAPHSSSPNADLELYRHAAGRMATAGYPQQARNLIDMILLSAGTGNGARVREAWFVCADIYSRLRQKHEGLVALSCGLSIQCRIDLQSAVREADVSCRLLRDFAAYDCAEHFFARSGELLKVLGLFDANALLHEYVGFSIEFGRLLKGPVQPAKLLDLLTRMHTNGSQVLARDLPPAPMALLIGQAVLIAQDEGLPVLGDVLSTRNMLGSKLAGRELDLFVQAATTSATSAGLLRLHRSSGPARYARDASYDATDTAIAARRLLSRKQLKPGEKILALELLCDRAIPLPGWQSVPQPVHQISAVGEPETWAVELSRRGIDIVLVGLDERGRAYSVLIRDGAIFPDTDTTATFDSEGFLAWSKHYPYLYGVEEKIPNLFSVSTEGLNFAFDPVKATAIVATNALQLLPPTLYRVGENCLGQLHPVFAAPSLGWLYTASSSPPVTDKRITGWISVAETAGVTLAMVRDRLGTMIEEQQVILDTGAALPDGLWGSELAFAVAHGSVLPEKRYFQQVSDEGVLKVTTEDFARAFKNIGVVVLFVCSAGRSDRAPEGESNYGLARELLAQGCSAVIASPWPVDPRVAYHWLPFFMNAWRDGKNVTQATFEANKYVEKNYSSELRNCLAMTVFGDGLRLRMT